VPNPSTDELARVDLFAGLSKKELGRLAAASREVTHPDGKTVIDEGGAPIGFHLIVDGQATVTTPAGKTRDLGPGDYFGEISLIDGKPRSASVVAKGRLRTQSLSSATFHSLLGSHPEIARAIMSALCQRLRALEQPELG
jgi:CRP/FNR family cyclic AMP-dependent transcriptional regulator